MDKQTKDNVTAEDDDEGNEDSIDVDYAARLKAIRFTVDSFTKTKFGIKAKGAKAVSKQGELEYGRTVDGEE